MLNQRKFFDGKREKRNQIMKDIETILTVLVWVAAVAVFFYYRSRAQRR